MNALGLDQPQASAVVVTGVPSPAVPGRAAAGTGCATAESSSRLLPEQPAEGSFERAHYHPELRQRPFVGRVGAQEGGDGAQPVVGERGQPDRKLADPAELVQRDPLNVLALPRGFGGSGNLVGPIQTWPSGGGPVSAVARIIEELHHHGAERSSDDLTGAGDSQAGRWRR